MTITSDTYSHLLEGVGRAAADAADALVPTGRAAPQLRDQPVTTPTLETTQRSRPEDESAGQERAPRGTLTPNPRTKSRIKGVPDGAD